MATATSSSVRNEITNLETQIAKLKQAELALLEQEKVLTLEQNVAIALHDNHCRWNHDDGCGWYYEFQNQLHIWNGNSHKDWLEKAVKFVKLCSNTGVSDRAALILAQQINLK